MGGAANPSTAAQAFPGFGSGGNNIFNRTADPAMAGRQMSPEAQRLMGGMMGMVGGAFGGGGGPVTFNGGAGQPAANAAPMSQPQPGMPPPMGQPAPNVYQQASGLYNAAAAGPNIGQFMNPYTSEVIGRTGMDMARQAQMAQNTLGAEATRAGAFGGSRQGVAQGTMLGDYGRAFGDIAAQQRQQGFNTALSAAQAQQGIQSGLAGQGFGFGQSIGATQAQEGQRQQAMNQALIDAAKGQFAGFTGAPQDALSTFLAALGGSQTGQQTQTQTSTSKPGWMQYITPLLGGL
jgi:hypothetical protein